MDSTRKKNTRWGNVILLSTSQALFQISSFIGSTLTVLVGLQLAPNESLATLPVSVGSLGTAAMMIPASLIIKKLGQRKGFMIGTLFGISAGLLCFYGINHNSFTLFVTGAMLVGCYQGFSQYYRFAAADSVPHQNKGKAISFVLAAGVVAAIVGPNLAKYTQHIGNIKFAYSYLSITLLSVVALVITSFLKLLDNNSIRNQTVSGQGRPLKEIVRQKGTLIALISSTVGYTVMVMIMTATPIAMQHCGHSTDDSATVIQWHLLGMYVPSFFTGIMVKKFGANKIILAGIFILSLHVAFALTGTDFMNFISGLILLGIGWNFMFIGGSTLLTDVYRQEEKEKTQAFHDFLLFTVITISSFSAGSLLDHWGWQGVNSSVIPLLLIAFIAMVLSQNKRKVMEKGALSSSEENFDTPIVAPLKESIEN